MSRPLIPALLLPLLLAGSAAFASPPTSPDAIPVFAGAVRDAAAEKAGALRDLYQWKGIGDGSEWVRVFLTTRPAEEVFAFYRDELRATEGDGDEIDLRALAAGTVTPASFGRKVEEGALRWAGMSWLAAGDDGGVTGFRIGIEGLPGNAGTRLVLWKEMLVQAVAR
jgi:hypothetical protein